MKIHIPQSFPVVPHRFEQCFHVPVVCARAPRASGAFTGRPVRVRDPGTGVLASAVAKVEVTRARTAFGRPETRAEPPEGHFKPF